MLEKVQGTSGISPATHKNDSLISSMAQSVLPAKIQFRFLQPVQAQGLQHRYSYQQNIVWI